MEDIRGRNIKLGDFVLANDGYGKGLEYAIVIGDNELLKTSGFVSNYENVFLIENMTDNENNIKNSLYNRYKEVKRKDLEIKKNTTGSVRGDMFLTSSPGVYYLYLGKCKINILNDSVVGHFYVQIYGYNISKSVLSDDMFYFDKYLLKSTFSVMNLYYLLNCYFYTFTVNKSKKFKEKVNHMDIIGDVLWLPYKDNSGNIQHIKIELL